MNFRYATAVGLTLLLTLLLSGLALAQDETESKTPWHSGNYFGVAGQFSVPTSAYAEKYTNGYGLQALVNYPWISVIDLSASVGWNRFPEGDDNSAQEIWEASMGMRFVLGAFFMNGEMGYFSNIDEWTFIPGLGARFDHWEFSLRPKAAGANTWTSFRVGYYF